MELIDLFNSFTYYTKLISLNLPNYFLTLLMFYCLSSLKAKAKMLANDD
jgi:hypothetical protein